MKKLKNLLLALALVPFSAFSAEGPYICGIWASFGVCHPESGELIPEYEHAMLIQGFQHHMTIDIPAYSDDKRVLKNYKDLFFRNAEAEVITAQCDQHCELIDKCPIGDARDPETGICTRITKGPYVCDEPWGSPTRDGIHLCDGETGEISQDYLIAAGNTANFIQYYFKGSVEYVTFTDVPHEKPPTSYLMKMKDITFITNYGNESLRTCSQQCNQVAACPSGTEATLDLGICEPSDKPIQEPIPRLQSDTTLYRTQQQAAEAGGEQAKTQGYDIPYGMLIYRFAPTQYAYSDILEIGQDTDALARELSDMEKGLVSDGYAVVGYVHTRSSAAITEEVGANDILFAQKLFDAGLFLPFFAVYTEDAQLLEYAPRQKDRDTRTRNYATSSTSVSATR